MSFSRRWLLRPPFPEHLTAAEIASAATVRAVIVAICLLADGVIYGLLAGQSAVRRSALDIFAAVNINLLSLDLMITLLWLRRPGRATRPLQGLCIVLEALAIAVWIQVTGSVSSYFISSGLLLVLAYRLFFDYRLALVGLLAMAGTHVAAFVGEELHWLRTAALFVDEPTGIYAAAAFRQGALVSIVMLYGVAFLAGNIVVLRLREKDSALRIAREQLLHAFNDAKLGRLSGRVLAQRYELGKVLGRGGMGEVYAARLLASDQRVAVKVLYEHLLHEPGILSRFRREVEAARRLPAGCAAQVLELGESEDGQCFIAMEHLVGEDLGALLRRRGRLPVAEAALLCEHIAQVLALAHDAGIVHRDLKPANIFVLAPLDQERPIRLLDFGISRLRLDAADHTLTETAAVLGSPGYLAPEQALAQHERVGPRTDLFALGAVLYYALTGEAAFPSRSLGVALHEAVHWHPPQPTSLVPSLSPDVDDVLALALAKDVDRRFDHARALATAFEQAARGALADDVRARARELRSSTPRIDATLTAQR